MKWSETRFDTSSVDGVAVVNLMVNHDHVDWVSQQTIYGWAALQYQTWTRGVIQNTGSEAARVLMYTTGILELWVNKKHHFGGDFYELERVPIILDLAPGDNVIHVRLIRDVRANGGHLPPLIEASLRMVVATERFAVLENSVLVPDIVDGHFVSPYGSVVVSNLDDNWITVGSIEILSSDNASATQAEILLAPGQSRPLPFKIGQGASFDLPAKGLIRYTIDGQKASRLSFEISPCSAKST